MLTPSTVENLHITSDSPNFSCPLVSAGVGYRTPFSPKNPPVSGPMQFKPGLFKGQLYLKKSPEHVKAHGKHSSISVTCLSFCGPSAWGQAVGTPGGPWAACALLSSDNAIPRGRTPLTLGSGKSLSREGEIRQHSTYFSSRL